MRETFLSAIRGMHHLASTEVCPGVYNSPFTAVLGGPPQVAGKTIEEHLRTEHRVTLTRKNGGSFSSVRG